MGWNQSKEEKTSNSLVSQTVNNNNSADHKLDTISWLLAALAVAFVITVTYLLWRRCKSSLKGWVVKQQAATNLATDANGSLEPPELPNRQKIVPRGFVVAKNDHYSIIISSEPIRKETPEQQSDTEEEINPDTENSENEWQTDAESDCGGRTSVLPTLGARLGVSKDLASERAREFFQNAKTALEKSRTLKRELRATAVENISKYEIVLWLADSRHRHRLNLEIERSRAAREMLRVEREHTKHLEEQRRTFESKLHEQKEAMIGTRSAVEGVQSWLDCEMHGLMKMVNAIQLEVRPALQPSQTQKHSLNQQISSALEEIKK
ncbi:hypothetical protein ACJJTC_011533 [Scirpophaga incertulas]